MIRPTTRLSRRSATDLRLLQRATIRITELSAILDDQMIQESRPEERIRHLRHATSQITRTANDAIQAYRRVAEAVRSEGERHDADPSEIQRVAQTLAVARTEMLSALEVASRRYPWAGPWRPAAADVPSGA